MAEEKLFSLVKKRMKIAFCLLLVLFAALITHLFSIQVLQGNAFQVKAKKQRLRTISIEPKRGIIYDRDGQELTSNISLNSVFAMPYQIKEPQQIAKQLSKILDLDEREVYSQLVKPKFFVWIRRRVKDAKVKQIKSLNLEGISFTSESKRFYPQGMLLSHALGFAGIDCQGLAGLERSYEKFLAGEAGKVTAEMDVAGLVIPAGYYQYSPPSDGDNLILTIDSNIQYIVEREVEKVYREYRAKGAVVIVMDPCRGEILALASRPAFDPNSFTQFPPSSWRNSALSQVYEPGSTFKVFLAAAALEEKAIKLSDKFYCGGSYHVTHWTIHDTEGREKGHGWLTLKDILKFSCNVGAVQAGLRLGEKKFCKYIADFGFGEKTGIDLPGEERGLFSPQGWQKITLATASFGQGIGVTPLQMIRGLSAIANGGHLMRPYLVKEIRSPEGKIIKAFSPYEVRRIISKKTARQLTEMLEVVTREGTGRKANLKGYRVAGKTGTAQKVGPGGYLEDKHVSSFFGFVPSSNPRLAILVVVDEPKGAYYGAVVAGPVFKRIAEETLCYLGVAPSEEGSGK